MLELGIRRLGYVSSTSALGKTEDGNAINLSTPWKNHPGLSGYAISKKRAELEVWRGMEEGLEVRVVNPGIIVGYGDWNKGSCATFRQVYDGLKFYSTGANGFVDVRDVCTQLIEMVEQPTDEKQRLLVGRNMTYQSYFEHIANAFGLKPPHLKIGKSLAQLAGALSGVPSFLGFKAHFLTPEIARSATTKATYVEKEGLIPIETSITFAAACYKKFQSSGG
jgi:nucleoside-diphosphate-sugar epimerase